MPWIFQNPETPVHENEIKNIRFGNIAVYQITVDNKSVAHKASEEPVTSYLDLLKKKAKSAGNLVVSHATLNRATDDPNSAEQSHLLLICIDKNHDYSAEPSGLLRIEGDTTDSFTASFDINTDYIFTGGIRDDNVKAFQPFAEFCYHAVQKFGNKTDISICTYMGIGVVCSAMERDF